MIAETFGAASPKSLQDLLPAWESGNREADPGTNVLAKAPTFLSFSLETEIEGVLPWRRAMTTGAGQLARATTAVTRPRPDS